MYTLLLVVHTLLAMAIIGLVLVQRSDGDGFGLSGGGNNFLSGRAKANILTRSTAIAAGLFFVTSLLLTILVNNSSDDGVSKLLQEGAAAPAVDVATPTSAVPPSAVPPSTVPPSTVPLAE